MKALVVIPMLLILSACDLREEGVFPETISEAQRICYTNGGINRIYHATVRSEFVSCGSRCLRATGRNLYERVGRESCEILKKAS